MRRTRFSPILQLEDRALPSGLVDADTKPGDWPQSTTLSTWLPPTTANRELYYSADGQSISLTLRSDRVTVGLTDASDAGVAKLSASGGPLAGLTFVRWLEAGAAVFEGASSLPASEEILFTAPVFINRASGRDAVALDEVIVALEPHVDPAAFFSDDCFLNYRPLWGTTDQFVATIPGRGVEAVHFANALSDDPRVRWSTPNFHQNWQKLFAPNDPEYTAGNLWHVTNVGQYGGANDADTDLDLAWDLNPGGSPNRLIAIVDDGVETGHPDLNPWVNPGEIAGDGKDNDGNGWIDDVNGWNFVNNNNNASFTTSERHGTAVAGLAAARGNNALGVAGGSYNARVMSARIFEGAAEASEANIASAVYYAAGRNKSGVGSFASVDVMNNSWGGGGYSNAIADAFSYATSSGRGGLGTVTLAASGNDYHSIILFPASLAASNPGLISVGGSNNKDTRAQYSNFGSNLDLVAPTADLRQNYLWIDTTDRTGAPGYNNTDYTGIGYGAFSGTSASTPIAAGIAGLVLSQAESKGVTLTAANVRNLLKNSTDLIAGTFVTTRTYDTATGNSLEYGRGRINAFTAVDGVGKPELSVLSMTAELPSAGSVNLGNALVNASTTQTFRIRNAGTSDLTLSNLAASGSGYSIDAGFGSGTLKLGEATTFTVRFAPTALGAAAGSISFTSNDADEAAYTLNFTATGVAANVTGRTFEDWNGNGTSDANDPSLAGRTVFLDANANGTLDRASYTATPNAAIPDHNASGITSTIVVSGQPAPVNRATVKLNITHPYVGDLAIWLVSPGGTTTWLASGIGGDGVNFTNTVFDNTAPVAVENGTAPYTGSFRPQIGHMTYMNGETANGTWYLMVADHSGGDVGTLVNWTIEFDGEHATAADSQGLFGFGGVANGAYTARSVATGWTATGSKAVTIVAPTDSFANSDLGSGKNSRVYLRARNDANANGTFESGEPGAGGRTFYRDANGNGQLDGEPSALTAGNGNALLDLTAGPSSVRLAPLAGWKFTNPADGAMALTAAGVPLFDKTFGTAEAVAPTATFDVNGGVVQRSMVSSVRIDFSEHVLFAGIVADAFMVTGPGGVVPFSASVDDSGTTTKVTLTFAGISLADGRYSASIAAGVTDVALNAITLPSPLDFHRLYGDVDGNGTLASDDFAIFGNAFASSASESHYRADLDFNSDGTISSFDFAEWGNRFGSTI